MDDGGCSGGDSGGGGGCDSGGGGFDTSFADVDIHHIGSGFSGSTDTSAHTSTSHQNVMTSHSRTKTNRDVKSTSHSVPLSTILTPNRYGYAVRNDTKATHSSPFRKRTKISSIGFGQNNMCCWFVCAAVTMLLFVIIMIVIFTVVF